MLKSSLIAIALAGTTIAAQSHQLWLERDAQGPVRVYVGDADDQHDRGEEVAKLVATTRVFGSDPRQSAKLVAKDDHLEVGGVGAGDVRFLNEQVWKPWQSKDGVWTTAVFNGRTGRSETRAVLDYEFVPVVANGNTFQLSFKGQPLAGKVVTVINADKWSKQLKTDAQGRVEVPVKAKGRYILLAAHSLAETKEIAGQAVAKVDYTTTLSFIAQ